MVECIAPPAVNIDRFLPPTPLRMVFDSEENNVTDDYPLERLRLACSNAPIARLSADALSLQTVGRMVDACSDQAAVQLEAIIADARESMNVLFDKEMQRLIFLQKRRHIQTRDALSVCRSEKTQIEKLLNNTRLRLEAIRVIQSVP